MYLTLKYCFSQFPLLCRPKKHFLLAQVSCLIFIIGFGQIYHIEAPFFIVNYFLKRNVVFYLGINFYL